jgi:Ca-activated chloride channel family protein
VLAEPLDERSVVVVALDTSTSMALGDVRPDRFTVAKDAAQDFVRDLPDDVEVGLVTFNAATALVASPTDDHEAVARAIADLTMAGGTAAGDGLVLAVDSAVAEVGAAAPATGPIAQVVLLADGASSVGLPLDQAAQRAADARVQVSTIAFGTPDLEVFYTPGVATDVGADLEALQQVADVTGGTAYAAPTSEALRDAYDDVGAAIDLAPRREDVSDLAAGLGVLALFAGAVPALLWTSRLA